MQTPFTPFSLRWEAPQLNAGDLAGNSSFEWWYFDCSTDDGLELVVVFSRRNPVFSGSKASMYVEYKDAHKRTHHVWNYDQAAFTWREVDGTRELRIERNSVRIRGSAPAIVYEIELDLPGMSANLSMTPVHNGFLPTADGCYFRGVNDSASRTCVSFSAPATRVQGSITTRGARRTVSGRGYHDHPWGTAQILSTHHEWSWGRIAGGDSDVMFADVRPASGYQGSLRFLCLGTAGQPEPALTGQLDIQTAAWKRESWLGLGFPHELTVQVPNGRWQATFSVSLQDWPVYNRSRVTWTPLGAGTPGSGWTEYYKMRLPAWLAFAGFRIRAFFWRPFPFIGR